MVRKPKNTICAAQLLHAAQPVTIDRNQRSRSPEYAPAVFDVSAADRVFMVIGAIVVVPVWPIFLILLLWEVAKYIADPPQKYVKFRFKRRHLVRKVSAKEIEDLERIVDPLHAVPDIPFGFLNEAWRSFHSQLNPLDSLWVTSARAMSGFRMEEREGYAIVRFCRIRRTMITSRIQIGEEG